MTRCGVRDTPLQERRRSAGGIKHRPRVTGRRRHLCTAEGNGLLARSHVPQQPRAGLRGTRPSPGREAGRARLFGNSLPCCGPGPRKPRGGGRGVRGAGRKGERLRKSYPSNEEHPRAPRG